VLARTRTWSGVKEKAVPMKNQEKIKKPGKIFRNNALTPDNILVLI
jgi:hypothetical protein